MSYANLKAEMIKHSITQAKAADLLGMTSNNFSMKVREKVPFTVPEIKRLRDEFFPAAHLDYLCTSDGDVPSELECAHAQAESLREVIDVSDEDMAQIHSKLDKIFSEDKASA